MPPQPPSPAPATLQQLPLPSHLSSSSSSPSSSLLSPAFQQKKAKILESLGQSVVTYTDKSPKGSIDAPIVDLIHRINEIDGLVTTSSCSGRVAVFVEGLTAENDDDDDDDYSRLGDIQRRGVEGLKEEEDHDYPPRSEDAQKQEGEKEGNHDHGKTETKIQGKVKTKVKTGPGGKGGGQWLFVSHEPVAFPVEGDQDTTNTTLDKDYFTKLCGLQIYDPDREGQCNSTRSHGATTTSSVSPPRLVRLSFSPLILHILTADLKQHARPLLAAAINAGFRESGVQSLAVLDQSSSSSPGASKSPDTTMLSTGTKAGTMLAIRTAGLAFETIIGQVVYTKTDMGGTKAEGKRTPCMQPLVSEEYLRLCFNVINERFSWNEKRKERLIMEIGKAFPQFTRSSYSSAGHDKCSGGNTADSSDAGSAYISQQQWSRNTKSSGWESKEDRSRRMRKEGLKRKEEAELFRQRKDGVHSQPGSKGLNIDMDLSVLLLDADHRSEKGGNSREETKFV